MLLILATVAISMAVDSNGLFARARKAAEDWNKSVGDESTAIENAMLIMNEIDGGSTSGGGTEEPPVEEKDTQPPTGSHTLTCEAIKKNGTTTIVVTGKDNVEVKQIKKPDGIAESGSTARYDISAIGNYDFEIEDTSGNKITYTVKVPRLAILPEGYVASSVEGEDTIENGLVIYEEGTEAEKKGPVTSENHATALTERNQYVWIPVDDINSMVWCKNNASHHINTETGICDTCGDITPTPLVGKLYTNSSGAFTNTTPQLTFDPNSGRREPAVVTGTGTKYDGAINESFGLGTAEVFLAHLQEEFSNMAKSVAKYKGFYISRYEIQAGAASKKGAGVLNAGSSSANMWYGLYTTIKNSNSPEKSTVAQMIWGSQYDQVILFALEKARTDGTGATFDVKTKNDATRKRNSSNAADLLSGAKEADKVCNIYDLENNYYEWTAEASNTSSRVYRGRPLQQQRFRFEPQWRQSDVYLQLLFLPPRTLCSAVMLAAIH